MEYEGDFAVTARAPLPAFGEPSSNPKIVSEQWAEDGKTLKLTIQARPGRRELFEVFGGDRIDSVEGGEWLPQSKKLLVTTPPAESNEYREYAVRIRFSPEE